MSTKMYHVSRTDLGKKVILTAKVPPCAGKGECQKTKRVCFSPSIRQCLKSIVSIEDASFSDIVFEFLLYRKGKILNPAIYSTQKALYLPKVNLDFSKETDLLKNQEQWSLKDIEVTRMGYLDLDSLIYSHKISITSRAEAKLSMSEIKAWKAGALSSRMKL